MHEMTCCIHGVRRVYWTVTGVRGSHAILQADLLLALVFTFGLLFTVLPMGFLVGYVFISVGFWAGLILHMTLLTHIIHGHEERRQTGWRFFIYQPPSSISRYISVFV